MQPFFGLVPALISPHTPVTQSPPKESAGSFRAARHDRHGPLQPDLQHTPSTQKPLRHSLLCVQGEAFVSAYSCSNTAPVLGNASTPESARNGAPSNTSVP